MLSWLEAHGRRVVNGRRVIELEMSKVDQLTALAAAGFDVPRTIAVIGREGLEFIETTDGRRVTYDINTNTNYNSVVDEQAGASGPLEVARFLKRLLAEERTGRRAVA